MTLNICSHARMINCFYASVTLIRCGIFPSNVEIMELVNQPYSPCPHVEFVDVIYDVKSLLREAKAELHNITNPHCFVLRETAYGDVVLKYKNWSRDKTWKPGSLPSQGVVVLEVGHSYHTNPLARRSTNGTKWHTATIEGYH